MPALNFPVGPALEALEALADRWHGKDGRFEIAAIPRFSLCCTRDMMLRAGQIASRRGLWVSTHLSENPVEVRIAQARSGLADYLAVYEDAGLVHDRSVYAHCIHLSPSPVGVGPVRGRGRRRRALPRQQRNPRQRQHAHRRGPRARHPLRDRHRRGRRAHLPRAPHPVVGLRQRPRHRADARSAPAPVVGHPRRSHGACATPRWARSRMDVPEWVETEDQALAAVLFDYDAPRPRRTWVRGEVVWDRDAAGAWPWWPTR